MLDVSILAILISPYLSIIPSIVAVYFIFKRNIPIIMNPTNVGLFLFFIWSAISGIKNTSMLSSLASIMFIILLIYNIYIEHILIDEKKITGFLHKVWKWSLAAGLIGIVEKALSYFVDMTWVSDLFFKGPYEPTVHNYRIYSTFGNPNIAGTFFGVFILLSLYLFDNSSGKKKGAYFFSIIMFIAALIATGSKGATLGLEIGIIIYIIFRKDKSSRLILSLIFILILILALGSPEINHSLNSRTGIWANSLELCAQSPVFGVGVFGIWDAIQKTHGHNIWVSLLTLFGIGGFTVYLWMRFYLMRSTIILIKNNHKMIPLLISIQALILGQGLVDFIIMAPQGAILFFISTTLITQLAKQYQRESYATFSTQHMSYLIKSPLKKS